ncbi:MAG: hypothetical protein TEF_00265 [Rhizobiales bacterium NRL2]|jgi:phage major head subunit gpT-like protein|nr:MAG: hypothetical protein TEF_00265 [Rhizobiales bacterium NRL2]
MIINRGNLATLFTGFKASFQSGIGQHQPQWPRVATRVPSTTSEEEYGWLGQVPNLREWFGDRVVQNLQQHDYSIKNRKFELTLGVPVDHIEDDKYGVYAPMFEEMGRSAAAHPDQLVWPLLKAGFSTVCYDGQNFFDTDHPVLDENGEVQSVANTDGGSGTPWFLMDVSRPLKPLIHQVRQEGPLVRQDAPTDEPVFNSDEYKYGIKHRRNVGFGFWQFAWGSKQTLNKANYKIARESLMGMTGDHGRPIGVMPRLLVVPPSLEGEALEILNAERDAAGATNVYKGTAELLVVPWLG